MQYLQVLATWFVMQVQVVSPRQVALISDCSLFSRKKVWSGKNLCRGRRGSYYRKYESTVFWSLCLLACLIKLKNWSSVDIDARTLTFERSCFAGLICLIHSRFVCSQPRPCSTWSSITSLQSTYSSDSTRTSVPEVGKQLPTWWERFVKANMVSRSNTNRAMPLLVKLNITSLCLALLLVVS